MQNQGRLVEKDPWRVNRQAQEGKQPARSKEEEPWRVNRQAQEEKKRKKVGEMFGGFRIFSYLCSVKQNL